MYVVCIRANKGSKPFSQLKQKTNSHKKNFIWIECWKLCGIFRVTYNADVRLQYVRYERGLYVRIRKKEGKKCLYECKSVSLYHNYNCLLLFLCRYILFQFIRFYHLGSLYHLDFWKPLLLLAAVTASLTPSFYTYLHWFQHLALFHFRPFGGNFCPLFFSFYCVMRMCYKVYNVWVWVWRYAESIHILYFLSFFYR